MTVGINPEAFSNLFKYQEYKEKADRLEKVLMEIYSWPYHAQPHDETELTEHDEGYDACLFNVKFEIEQALGLDGE